MFKIQTEQFEGPLDLLLQLIEKDKMDITSISLAKITDEYLKEIEKLDPKSHDIAEFVLVASKLLYIKSKVLLPHLETQEEEDEIDDLEEKLREYKKYKEMADKFHETLEQGFRSFKKGLKAAAHVKGFVPPEGIELNDLFNVLKETLSKVPEEEEIQHEKTFERLVTVEEKRLEIKKDIFKKKKTSFRELLRKAKTRHEIVVSFLAVLDLMKQKEIKVIQDKSFGDIIIEVTEKQKNKKT